MATDAPPPDGRTATLLFIWDFDNTIVLNDTDRAAVSALAPELVRTHLHNRELVRQLGWTATLNLAFRRVAQQGHAAATLVEAAAEGTCLPAETAGAVRAVAVAKGAMSAIISDSNDRFIKACLKRHDLLPTQRFFAAGLYTNAAVVTREGVLQVVPYTEAMAQPHACPTCPQNLCKGLLAQQVMQRHLPPPRAGDNARDNGRVVYVGDGQNDFCAVRTLHEADFVLYREGYSLERCIRDSGEHIKASALGWSTPQQLQQLVQRMLNS